MMAEAKPTAVGSGRQNRSHTSDKDFLIPHTHLHQQAFFRLGQRDHAISLAIERLKVAMQPAAPAWMMDRGEHERDIPFARDLQRGIAEPFAANATVVDKVRRCGPWPQLIGHGSGNMLYGWPFYKVVAVHPRGQ